MGVPPPLCIIGSRSSHVHFSPGLLREKLRDLVQLLGRWGAAPPRRALLSTPRRALPARPSAPCSVPCDPSPPAAAAASAVPAAAGPARTPRSRASPTCCPPARPASRKTWPAWATPCPRRRGRCAGWWRATPASFRCAARRWRATSGCCRKASAAAPTRCDGPDPLQRALGAGASCGACNPPHRLEPYPPRETASPSPNQVAAIVRGHPALLAVCPIACATKISELKVPL
jgi:hypothetical protein